jgi:tetratricopeptide (TPR) repeat protein
MRRYLVITLLMGLLVLMTCRQKPSYPATLLQADSLTLVAPEEAISLLNSLAKDMESAPQASRMYYELLCIKAADKAYIIHTSDSIIRNLVDYYEQEGDERLLAETYYYAGRVYRDIGDAPQALAYFQKSLEAEDEEVNPALYAQIGEIFFGQSLFSEALGMYQKAYQLDSIANDTAGCILDLRDIAFSHRVEHRLDSALFYLQKAKLLANQYNDAELQSLVSAQQAALLSRMGQADEALSLIEEAYPHAGKTDRYAMLDIYANILLRQGKADEAQPYFEEMTDANDLQVLLDAYNGLTQIAALKKQSDNYLAYFDEYRALSDSLRRISATESVSRMNALYNYQLHEQENASLKLKNQQKLTIIIALICASIILFVSLFSYYRYRRLQMKQRLEHVQRLLKEHMEKEVRQEEHARVEQAIQDSDVMQRLMELIEKEKPLTDAAIADIEALLDEVSPGFLPLLRKLGELTPMEYQVCLLIKLNLTPIQMATLMLRDKSTISAIRRRLYKKITGQDGSPADWDNIIHSL